MSIRTAFESRIYFYALGLLSPRVGPKKLSVMLDVISGTVTGRAVQFVRKAWDALKKSCSLGLQRVMIHL